MTNFNIDLFSESKNLIILHANTIISKYNTNINVNLMVHCHDYSLK